MEAVRKESSLFVAASSHVGVWFFRQPTCAKMWPSCSRPFGSWQICFNARSSSVSPVRNRKEREGLQCHGKAEPTRLSHRHWRATVQESSHAPTRNSQARCPHHARRFEHAQIYCARN
eukprot:scaffold157811_cov31-Tisochrysis_lutea.AAC.2